MRAQNIVGRLWGGGRSKARVSRFWEVDALRGVAIIMMVIFHLMWDLWFFRVLPNVVLYAGFWKYFQRTTASLFIVLVGVSLTISYRRKRRRAGAKASLFPFYLRRGLTIVAWGVVFHLVVWSLGIGVVHFGVLHLIGTSIILAYPLLERRWLNLWLFLLLFALGGYVQTIHPDWLWLVWLGFHPVPYGAVDYFPLIPWFGGVLLGVFLGNTLYDVDGLKVWIPDLSGWLPVQALGFLGRNSLFFYLIHQPLLFGILVLLGIVSIG